MPVPHGYAQTNLELYAQLRQAEYSLGDLNHIRRAYEFACELFTCQHRPSGKSFLSHLIGTASIVGNLKVSKEIIAAGLLHAAYERGDFGDKSPGSSSWKRKQVRLRVGHHTEEYIAKYDALKWNAQTIPVIHQLFPTMGMVDRDVLLLRLANELEDLLDYGLVYLPNYQDRLQRYQEWKQEHIELAAHLGYPALASELRCSIEGTIEKKSTLPVRVQSSISQIWPITVLPPSYEYQFLISLRHRVAEGINWLAERRGYKHFHPIIAKITTSRIANFLKKRIPFMGGA